MIRPVRSEDAAAIASIYNEYVQNTTISFETTPVTVEDMHDRIRNYSAHYPYLVVEESDIVRGYCCVHPWKERAAYCHTWETTIYLHPGYCGKGIGKGLMQELIRRCKAVGCHALIACITGDNINSCEFHRRLGFSQVSLFREVGFKFGKWLDVADFQLLL